MGRFAQEDPKAPFIVLKDKNWLAKSKRLHLGPLKRKALLDQLEKDVAVIFLLILSYI